MIDKKFAPTFAAIANSIPLMIGLLPWMLTTNESPQTDEERFLSKEIESHVRTADWAMVQAEHLKAFVECLENDIKAHGITSIEVNSNLRVHQAMADRYAKLASNCLSLADEKQARYDEMRTKTKAAHREKQDRSVAASKLGINKYERCIQSGEGRVDCGEMAAFARQGTKILSHCKEHAVEAGIENFDDPIDLLKAAEDDAYEVDRDDLGPLPPSRPTPSDSDERGM
jgi:hypothetical protein